MRGKEVERHAEQQRVKELRPAVVRGNEAGDESEQRRKRDAWRDSSQALSYSRVSTNSRWPSASAAVSLPLAVRNMHSSSLSPAWSGDSSLRSRPETSTSMCSDIVRTVRGFAHSLITGRIGLPMTLPCPVGKKWTA